MIEDQPMQFDLDRIASLIPGPVDVAIILGSGLGHFADTFAAPQAISTTDLPGYPVSTVAGHAGELVAGTLEGVAVLLQNGRFHLYEGHDPATVGLPARIFAKLGVEIMIVTNRAGFG